MQDRRIFREVIEFLRQENSSAMPVGQMMLDIGKFFLKSSYASGTLETKKTEHLIVNLREFDCFTFVENVIALARLMKSRERSFEAFRAMLRKIRYREGRPRGYASRLHYFSDWIHDNEKKEILKDVTRKIGGSPLRKPLAFMTTHPDLYPPLRNPATFNDMKSVERRVGRRSLSFIPKQTLRRAENRIQDGDIIAITTNTEGLDVQHVGLAAKMKNRIHLLHASRREGGVVLSKETLYRYLMRRRARTGIMVSRVG